MTLATHHRDARSSRRDFAVTTTRQDPLRAELELTGWLDDEAAPVLAATVDAHLRAGRRILRADLAGLEHVSSAAATLIGTVHHRLLARRGGLLLHGAPPSVQRALAEAAPDLLLMARMNSRE